MLKTYRMDGQYVENGGCAIGIGKRVMRTKNNEVKWNGTGNIMSPVTLI